MSLVTVLGAGGFIGGALVARLIAEGRPVDPVTRDDLPALLSARRPAGDVIYCIGLTADFRTRPLDTAEAHVDWSRAQMLRKHGVVGKFVEFFGDGLKHLSLADRATIANMAPEYGATCGIFPIDAEAINYLRLSGREEAHIKLVEQYAKAQGLWHDDNDAARRIQLQARTEPRRCEAVAGRTEASAGSRAAERRREKLSKNRSRRSPRIVRAKQQEARFANEGGATAVGHDKSVQRKRPARDARRRRFRSRRWRRA